MALNKTIPNESIENVVTGQIDFESLVFEGEFEEERETKQYFTISGKEQMYEPSWTKYKMADLSVGDEMEGRVEITHFVNDGGRKSDSLRVRVMEDGDILDLYVNIPKPDENGFVTNIRKGFDYYRTGYDFIYSVLRNQGDEFVIDANGEEINNFKRVNIIDFAKYVDQHSRIGVRIIEGNSSSEYNSFIIYKME